MTQLQVEKYVIDLPAGGFERINLGVSASTFIITKLTGTGTLEAQILPSRPAAEPRLQPIFEGFQFKVDKEFDSFNQLLLRESSGTNSLTVEVFVAVGDISDNRLTLTNSIDVDTVTDLDVPTQLSTSTSTGVLATSGATLVSANNDNRTVYIGADIDNDDFVVIGRNTSGGFKLYPGDYITINTTAAIEVYNPNATTSFLSVMVLRA